MKTLKYILTITILLLFISCSKNEQQPLSVGNIERSDCKSNMKSETIDIKPDTLCCIKYSYNNSTNQLSITHINAGFNCCPGEICCIATVSGDTLVIEETESTSICDCSCLFDLTFTIDNVEDTPAFMKIKEPYWSGSGSIVFDISLKKEKEGSWCTTRKNYPWGM
jgi:hypothetical protein